MQHSAGYYDDEEQQMNYSEEDSHNFNEFNASGKRATSNTLMTREVKSEVASYRIPDSLDPSQRKNFPFRIFIKDQYLTEGIASRIELDDIIAKTGVDSISLDN